MQEYHDLYLKCDVILLCDVFESFRKFSLKVCELDPLHYYTAPGLSLGACLKMTGVKLELFTSPRELLFIESGVRGGVATISKRHAVANNKYMPNYDPNKPSNYIMVWDCNN